MDHRFSEISLRDIFKIVEMESNKNNSCKLIYLSSCEQLKLCLMKRDKDELYITSCNLI